MAARADRLLRAWSLRQKMRGCLSIRKPKRPPKPLTEYLAEPVGVSYDDSPKQMIREALATEQGYLCYAPFCEAVLFYLRKRLARCPR